MERFVVLAFLRLDDTAHDEDACGDKYAKDPDAVFEDQGGDQARSVGYSMDRDIAVGIDA